jgi:leucyl-tRNA synthetase
LTASGKIDLRDDDMRIIKVEELTDIERNALDSLKEFVLDEKIEELYLDIEFLFTPIHVGISFLNDMNDQLNLQKFKKWKSEFESARFILENGEYITEREVEKMSKSKYNVVNPNDIIEQYGADTFRMYEMFLGPVEMSKPWDTKGIEGVHRFLKKLWRLFFDEKGLIVTDEPLTSVELKLLHKTIKKIEEDTERFSFNTTVSAYMVCVNELMDLKSHKRQILEPLLITLTPYAPHIAEELWHMLGNESSILDATFPTFDPKHLVESAKEYPISINGKMRTQIVIDLNADKKAIEDIVLQNTVVQKWLEGKAPKKIIYVKGKMVNVVI